MITVACVLRSGGEYGPRHVHALQAAVERNMSPEHRFVCLTDVPVDDVASVPLEHDWPGYWAKAELFRPDLFTGRVLYFDLDMVIVRDVSVLAGYEGRFMAMRDHWRDDTYSSAIMAWDGDHPPLIYEIAQENGMPMRGRFDVWWNQHVTPSDALQEFAPGIVGSYKAQSRDQWRSGDGPDLESGPRDYAIVDFHGEPKPWDLGGEWPHEAWAA